jgi:hypothetical protein
MPECHKCKHNEKKSDACLNCDGPSHFEHGDGVNKVSLDAAGQIAEAPSPEQNPYDLARQALSVFRRLEAIDLFIITRRMDGVPFEDIAQMATLAFNAPWKMANIHRRMKAAIAKDSLLAETFAEMTAKQKTRKVHAR